jgi:hypothetical protein
MRAQDARSIARQWLHDEVSPLDGFVGALWHGSVLDLVDDEPIGTDSDIDLILIFDECAPSLRRGKLLVGGAILDLTPLQWNDIRDAEVVLGNHQLAPSFRSAALLADPSGALAELCDVIERQFPRREWVDRRCDRAIGAIRRNLAQVELSGTQVGQVMSWLFGTGITTHVLLVAGLRNPTVRKRYVTARSLLHEAGRPEIHEILLRMLGSHQISAERASHHLSTLTKAFDDASRTVRTQVPFATDLSQVARPIAIDGSEGMIANGDHREAMFWIAVTWARCMQVFHLDDRSLEARFEPAFRSMLSDLGISSIGDMRERAGVVETSLSWLREIASGIMDATPEIRG